MPSSGTVLLPLSPWHPPTTREEAKWPLSTLFPEEEELRCKGQCTWLYKASVLGLYNLCGVNMCWRLWEEQKEGKGNGVNK